MQGADRDKEQEVFRRTLVPLHVERETYLTRKYISASGYKHNCTDVGRFANEYFRFLWKLSFLASSQNDLLCFRLWTALLLGSLTILTTATGLSRYTLT